MITLNNVSKTYRTDKVETLALKDIDLHVRPGQGSIDVGGQPVQGRSDKQLAQLRNQAFGFIFQSFHLIPDLRVIDNVGLPLLYRKMGNAERRALARAALEKVGLGARMDHYPNQLSGGQQQRVAIARAIVGQPQILLADEPTGNLDSKMGEDIMDILLDLNRGGTTVVMVTHDEQQARRVHRIVRVFDGQLVA
jgi:putative ABC transport system ATP-binding protein